MRMLTFGRIDNFFNVYGIDTVILKQILINFILKKNDSHK